MTRRFIIAFALCGACSSTASRTLPSPNPSGARTAPSPSRAVVDSLIEALRVLPGEFRYVDPERTGSYFTGGEALFRTLGTADTLAVPALIECFGNTQEVAATLDGRRLQHGKLCYRAFIYTPYYQQRLRSAAWMAEFKSTGQLPGRLSASDEELGAARAWWKRYVAAGSPLRP